MKVLAFAALSMFSVFASAEGLTAGSAADRAISGSYATQTPQKTAGIAKSTKTYVDGSGHEHSLEYTTPGDSRQNG
jgi:hypothetical protein